MTTWVLDASVAVAWYLPENFQVAARQWQRRLLDDEIRLLIPSLHYWELGNVLRTYVRRREIAEDLAREIYNLHLDARLNLAEPDRTSVLETALKYEATVYDAVYIALALEQGVSLLTAERSTTPWVVKLGKRAVSIAGS
jgi:predicted nucleic acid-binding protein